MLHRQAGERGEGAALSEPDPREGMNWQITKAPQTVRIGFSGVKRPSVLVGIAISRAGAWSRRVRDRELGGQGALPKGRDAHPSGPLGYPESRDCDPAAKGAYPESSGSRSSRLEAGPEGSGRQDQRRNRDPLGSWWFGTSRKGGPLAVKGCLGAF